MKISVIIPIYNSEKYLRSCLTSVLNQTYENIEVIAIDDASSDNSLNILNEFKEKYVDKLKVIHLDNNIGLSNARNLGIDSSCGSYLSFIDSDDYINYGMYENMARDIIKHNYPDILTTGITFVKDDYYLDNNFLDLKHQDGTMHNILNDSSFILNESPSVCNKLFKKEFVNTTRFVSNIVWEDIPFTYALFFNANTVVTSNNFDYFYRKRLGIGLSQTGLIPTDKIIDIFDAVDKLLIDTKKTGRYNLFKDKIDFIAITSCLERITEVMKWNIKEDEKETVIKSLLNYIKTRYGDWNNYSVEELSSKIGIIELERINKLMNINTLK